MKLSKEQVQKIALGTMMFFGIIYAYFEFLLSPLTAGREHAVKEAADLAPKIAAAQAQIAKVKAIEAKAPGSELLVEQVKAMIPQGAPVAWVPTRLTDILKAEGVAKASARMAGEPPEKELPGFGKCSWTVDIPQVEFITLGRALSALENAEPLMEVQTLEIEAGRDEAVAQRVTFTIHNIVRL